MSNDCGAVWGERREVFVCSRMDRVCEGVVGRLVCEYGLTPDC